jgi:nucleoside-triphosphatase THEP1
MRKGVRLASHTIFTIRNGEISRLSSTEEEKKPRSKKLDIKQQMFLPRVGKCISKTLSLSTCGSTTC